MAKDSKRKRYELHPSSLYGAGLARSPWPRIVIRHTGNRYWWVILARNGKTIAPRETSTEASAERSALRWGEALILPVYREL